MRDLGAQMQRKPFHRRASSTSRKASPARSTARWKSLGAADYKLSCHLPTGDRRTPSACAPAGVVAAASEEGGVVTNGMSEFARDGENANAALLCNVEPEDFGGEDVLAGVEFQRNTNGWPLNWGKKLPRAGADRGRFPGGTCINRAGKVAPSYAPGVTLTDLAGCLPGFAVTTLRSAIVIFFRCAAMRRRMRCSRVWRRAPLRLFVFCAEKTASRIKGVISPAARARLCGRHHAVRRGGRSALRHRLNSKP